MPKNKTVRFRVSKQQWEQLLANAEANRYVSLSPYLRDRTLGRDSAVDRKIHEIRDEIQEIHAVIVRSEHPHHS